MLERDRIGARSGANETCTPQTIISVITPTLNEGMNLTARARELAAQAMPWEWIVSDGGSTDDTVAVASAAGALVVHATRGRGPQLNAGAARARGDVYVFLHADTRLPQDAFAHLRSALADPEVVGGSFTFAFDDPSFTGRVLESVYALKRIVFGLWYGDSVIFVRAQTFAAMDGFALFPAFEDTDFVERLHRFGRTRRLAPIVTTSARRYQGRVVQTVFRWTTLFALYKCGVSPQLLARFYPPHAEAPARLSM